jgi:hypothetical protein
MNTEEDEFRRIEAEALRLWAAQTDDDDDTQVYKKPWVGLTDEQIAIIVRKVSKGSALRPMNAEPTSVRIARAIEAKLKEKNT